MTAQVPALGETLVAAASIRARVAELAAAIDSYYRDAGAPLLLLCVLKGSLLFTADLSRHLTIPVEIDVVAVRSYRGGTRSSGRVELMLAPASRVRGRDVLIVEDIVDSGHTADFLVRHVAALEARTVRLVTFLDKTSRRERAVEVHWKGFDIPDRFVVGYGLDHDERFRNLPDVHVLDGV